MAANGNIFLGGRGIQDGTILIKTKFGAQPVHVYRLYIDYTNRF